MMRTPPLGLHPAIPAYIHSSFLRTYAYRARFFLWIIRWMIRLYLLRMVWESVYGERDIVDGVTLNTMLSYLTVSLLHDYVTQSNVVYEIDSRIQSGSVATDMVRPLPFVEQMIALDIGTVLARIPFLVITLPFAAMIGSMALPVSGAATIGYLISAVLSWAVSMLVWMIVGLVGFWMTNTVGLRFMLGTLQAFLTGTMIPLWFMPDVVRAVLEWTPFPMMVYVPVSIYVGERTGTDIPIAIGAQLAWIVVLASIVWFEWRAGRTRLVVQGG